MVGSAHGVKSIHLQQVNGFLKCNAFLQKPAPSIAIHHTNKMCVISHSKRAHIVNKTHKLSLHKIPLTRMVPNKTNNRQNKNLCQAQNASGHARTFACTYTHYTNHTTKVNNHLTDKQPTTFESVSSAQRL